jgi:hypothetical protein
VYTDYPSLRLFKGATDGGIPVSDNFDEAVRAGMVDARRCVRLQGSR